VNEVVVYNAGNPIFDPNSSMKLMQSKRAENNNENEGANNLINDDGCPPNNFHPVDDEMKEVEEKLRVNIVLPKDT
jgi:hypothetical protein